MAKKNRMCLTCGTKYSYCPNCNRKDPAWMAEFHSEACKSIFDICTRFNMKLMSKAEAQEALHAFDLSNKDSFKDYVQRDLTNIFAEEPKAKRGKRVEAKPVDEVAAVEETESHEVVNKTEE